MIRLPMLALAAAAAAVAFAAIAGAAPYRPPRTAWGAPDLQGVWTNESMTRLERPKEFKTLTVSPAEAAAYEKRRVDRYEKEVAPVAAGEAAPPPVANVGQDAPQWYKAPLGLARIGGQLRSSWIVDPADGRLPLTEAGRVAAKAVEFSDDNLFDNPDARPIDERCVLGPWLPAGPPLTNPTTNPLLQIVQTRDHVVIVVEMNHDARIIRLGARGHQPAALGPWMGDSIGHWEGQTLVVETTGFNRGDSWQLGFYYVRMSPAAKVVERFTRTGPAEILYQFEGSDPAIFTRSWRGEMPLRATRDAMFEYACHEGNYSFANALAGARKIEKEARPARTAPAPSGSPRPASPPAP
jgi:hypothetical protein